MDQPAFQCGALESSLHPVPTEVLIKCGGVIEERAEGGVVGDLPEGDV